MTSLKHHDRKKKHADICHKKYMHRKTRMCSRKYPLHLLKFANSGYYAFFSQLLFKIYMKVVSLKMVTNIYWDLRSDPYIYKLVSTEIPV